MAFDAGQDGQVGLAATDREAGHAQNARCGVLRTGQFHDPA